MRVAQPIETKEVLEASWLPPRPSLKPITGRQIDVVNHCCYQPYFGDFEWDDNPTPDERDGIKIRGTWAKENIIYVSIPQVKEIRGGMGGTIMFNIRAASQLKALWQAWEACGFVSKVNKVWGYAPRYQRNNHSFISNHAWGTAFDINEDQNKQGHEPARLGEYGCVREMVEVANRYGFYWGGHWDGASRDGMHFEVAKCM
jgi:hypothetical protein